MMDYQTVLESILMTSTNYISPIDNVSVIDINKIELPISLFSVLNQYNLDWPETIEFVQSFDDSVRYYHNSEHIGTQKLI